MTRLESEITGELGVSKIRTFFVERSHIFREQHIADHGIDAYVEFVDPDRAVTGRLVALQIKAGDRVLDENRNGDWVMYPARRHVQYWLNHSLPVYIAFWHRSADVIYVREVSELSLEKTKSGYKITFDQSCRLEDGVIDAMMRRADGTEDDRRMALLDVSYDLRADIPEAESLWIGVQHWTKTDLCQISIHRRLPQEGVSDGLARWDLRVPESELVPYLRDVFAWADLSIEADFYRKEERDDWTQHLFDLEAEPDQLPFEAWWQQLPDDRPFARDDDVSNWMFDLRTNDLGRAWRTVRDYIRR